MSFLATAGAAFGLLFVAELGDKTQLVLLTLAARGHPWRVWAGASLALALVTVAGALGGDVLARFLPGDAVAVGAGLLFIAFGVWTLRGNDPEETAEGEDGGGERVPEPEGAKRAAFLGAFGLLFVAEMGDKTQLAVAAFSAREGTWLAPAVGGALALATTSAIAVGAGGWLARKVPPARIRQAAGWLFVAFGVFFVIAPWL